ncbi:MAG: hypothetical protein ABIE14_03925 [Patescibacteria group bacterium]
MIFLFFKKKEKVDLREGMVPLSELDGITPEELEFLGKSGISLARSLALKVTSWSSSKKYEGRQPFSAVAEKIGKKLADAEGTKLAGVG